MKREGKNWKNWDDAWEVLAYATINKDQHLIDMAWKKIGEFGQTLSKEINKANIDLNTNFD